MADEIEFGSLEWFSRKLVYIFAFFVFYTFAFRQSHLPKNAEEIGTFAFLWFFNVGVQWAFYRLTHMCTRQWLDWVIFSVQMVMFGWTVYAFRFAYIVGATYTQEKYFYVPLQQYGVAAVFFIVLLILYTKDTKG